ncbi:MAG TPA: hypothetical protein VMS81_08000 [Methanomicrobiales archaeon]|jgi:hypothetical protein|nr:hypothetical protein [Methanomicrobiales archaeon]
MERFRLVSLALVLAVLAPAPATALHARYLDIGVGRNGDATVTFEYTLPWIEQALAFLGLANPDRDLGQILAASANGQVDRLSASTGTASFSVRGFANVTVNPGSATYDTSPVNLSWGQIGYESSILAPLLEPDFSPDVTVIRFPDAYSVTFRDLLIIPNVTHTF